MYQPGAAESDSKIAGDCQSGSGSCVESVMRMGQRKRVRTMGKEKGSERFLGREEGARTSRNRCQARTGGPSRISWADRSGVNMAIPPSAASGSSRARRLDDRGAFECAQARGGDLDPFLPVVWPAVEMSDRNDQDLVRSHLIDDAIREPVSTASPRVLTEGMPALGESFDPLQRRADLIAKFSSQPRTLSLVITDRFTEVVARGFQESDHLGWSNSLKTSSAGIAFI